MPQRFFDCSRSHTTLLFLSDKEKHVERRTVQLLRANSVELRHRQLAGAYAPTEVVHHRSRVILCQIARSKQRLIGTGGRSPGVNMLMPKAKHVPEFMSQDPGFIKPQVLIEI